MPNKKTRSLSFSALNTYDFCAANWLGTYELKRPEAEFIPTPDSAVGKATHRAMKRLNEKRRDGIQVMPNQLERWARDFWKEEKTTIRDHEQMSEADNLSYQNWTIMHALSLASKTRDQKPVMTEKYLSMPLVTGDEGQALWYFGCVVDNVTDPIVVWDYKTFTGRSVTQRDREKYRLQAAGNSAVVRHHLGLDFYPDVHLVFSDDTTCEDWLVPLTETSIEDVLDQARRTATEIDLFLANGTPFPRSKHCKFCPLQGECPQTIEALAAA